MCMHRYTCVSVYVYMFACVCLNIIYIYMYKYMQTFTHKPNPKTKWNKPNKHLSKCQAPTNYNLRWNVRPKQQPHSTYTKEPTSRHSQLSTSKMKKPNLSNTASRTTIKWKTRDTLKHKSQQQATSQLEIKLEKTLFGTSEEPKFKKTKTHRMG